MRSSVLLLLLLGVSAVCCASDPSYDHQTSTYNVQFEPVSVKGESLTITTYFSPDHSADVETKFVESATTSIDIGTPGWDSWSGCTPFTGPVGCAPSVLRSTEAFPIFQAVLNAIHRGVKVRILTNNYNQADGSGLIDPLSFLALAGAQVRYYTTTTFLHAKYIGVDSTKVSISSVNYDYTSFMENREAGVLVTGSGAAPIGAFCTSVFNFDFGQGLPWPVQSYNSSDMAVIKNPAPITVVMPTPRNYSGAYVTGVNTIKANYKDVTVWTSPDYSYDTLTQALNGTQSSLKVYIYQVTGYICNILQDLNSRGVSLTILVSRTIYSEPDWKLAQACYTTLYNAGVTIRETAAHMYKFSHQKFWIIDGHTVVLSTGNWSPTDYPAGAPAFPPYSESGWRDTNRDFTISATNSQLVAVYENVMEQDYEIGNNWSPHYDEYDY